MIRTISPTGFRRPIIVSGSIWNGICPGLRELREVGEIEILEERRLFFGSLWH
jgi:hypothetical protein